MSLASVARWHQRSPSARYPFPHNDCRVAAGAHCAGRAPHSRGVRACATPRPGASAHYWSPSGGRGTRAWRHPRRRPLLGSLLPRRLLPRCQLPRRLRSRPGPRAGRPTARWPPALAPRPRPPAASAPAHPSEGAWTWAGRPPLGRGALEREGQGGGEQAPRASGQQPRGSGRGRAGGEEGPGRQGGGRRASGARASALGSAPSLPSRLHRSLVLWYKWIRLENTEHFSNYFKNLQDSTKPSKS